MAEKIYVVGPRPIYLHEPEEPLDEAVIISAPPQYEGEPAKSIALKLSPGITNHFNKGNQISCESISELRVPEMIRRGAADLRMIQKSRAAIDDDNK